MKQVLTYFKEIPEEYVALCQKLAEELFEEGYTFRDRYSMFLAWKDFSLANDQYWIIPSDYSIDVFVDSLEMQTGVRSEPL